MWFFFICVYFFFFKQKTAYEMRISDWSSDVCSSDLAFHRLVFDLDQLGGILGDIAVVGHHGGHPLPDITGDADSQRITTHLRDIDARIDRKSTRLNSSH